MRLRILAALTLLSTCALAQPKRPITFADLQALHRIADPQISPSGRWVLFSVTDVSLEHNTKTTHLWIVPLAGGKETQLTTGTGESNGRFSPDGKTIMFSADDQIQLAPWDDTTGTLAPAHPITTLETGADGGLWAPDSRHFLFTSSVYPECESTSPNRAVAEARCNAEKDAAATKSPVKAQIFTDLLFRHWNMYFGGKHTHIFYADIDGSGPLDITPASVVGDHEAPTFSLGGPLGYAISPDGKEIAYVTNLDKVPAESTNNDLFTLAIGADPHTAKKVSTSPGSDDGPQYSPDGKYLAWRSQKRGGFESDRFRLVLYDREKGIANEIALKLNEDGSNADLDRWVDEFTWVDDSQHILFVAGDQGDSPVYETNITGDDLKRMGKAAGEWSSISCVLHKGRQLLVGSFMRVNRPTEIVAADPNQMDDAARRGVLVANRSTSSRKVYALGPLTHEIYDPPALTHLNDALLSQLDLPNMESFTFPGANGTKVQGFLIRPPNFDPSQKYPVKFLIHGGPQGAWGDAWSYRWNPELFAANGYVVVMVNPRGSTGYGQQFVDEVSGDWGGRPYIDLMRGLDYAEKTYPFIDKSRECALGASYGGFMANWILTHTTRFACIVSHDGAYNLQSMFGTTEELWFPEWEFRPLVPQSHPFLSSRKGSAVAGAPGLASETWVEPPQNLAHATVDQTHPAHPWDFAELPASQDPFRKWSPRMYIDQAKTPTLVIHGQKDYRLDVSEGLQLFTALQLRNVPSKFLYFPDEGHWVLKPQNSQLWYTTVNDWVDQWTHTNAYAK